MKQTHSESELKELAGEAFKQYPAVNKLYATVDGNVFIDENRANIHAGAKGRVLPFDRPVAKEVTAPSIKAEDVIKSISEATTLEELEAFKADTRKTVVKALDEKTAELKAAKQE